MVHVCERDRQQGYGSGTNSMSLTDSAPKQVLSPTNACELAEDGIW